MTVIMALYILRVQMGSLSTEPKPAALAVSVLVHRIPELLGLSQLMPADESASALVYDNGQSLQPIDDAKPIDRTLSTCVQTADDETVEGCLRCLTLDRYTAQIEGLVNIVLDVQKDVKRMSAHLPWLSQQNAATAANIDNVSDDRVLHVTRAIGLFVPDDTSWSELRRVLCARVDAARTNAMRLKRLRINASASFEEIARSVRSAIASATMLRGSKEDGVAFVGTPFAVSPDQAVRRGIYETIVKGLCHGQSLPAGLPRPIDMCARRVAQSEAVRREAEWVAQVVTSSRKVRVYMTRTFALDVQAALCRESSDEDGRYVVDEKTRESRFLGIQEHEQCQAQLYMWIWQVDRLLHVERLGSGQTQSTWVFRCTDGERTELLNLLRATVRSKVLAVSGITKGAVATDTNGRSVRIACREDLRVDDNEVPLSLDGMWTIA